MEQLQKQLFKLRMKLLLELWYQIFLKFAIAAIALSIVYVVVSKWKYLIDDTVFFAIVIVFVLHF